MANTQVVGKSAPFGVAFSVPLSNPNPPPTAPDIVGQYPLGQVYIQTNTNPASNTVSFLTAQGVTPTWTTFAANVSPVSSLVVSGSLQLSFAGAGSLVTDSSGNVSSVNSSSSNAVLIARGTGTAPSFGQIVGGAGVVVATSGNNIQISASGTGLAWTSLSSGTSTQTALANNGYLGNNATLTSVTLPASPVLGTVVAVAQGAASPAQIQIIPNTGQIIQDGNTVISASSSQEYTSDASLSNQYIEVLALTNAIWIVRSKNGNFVVT